MAQEQPNNKRPLTESMEGERRPAPALRRRNNFDAGQYARWSSTSTNYFAAAPATEYITDAIRSPSPTATPYPDMMTEPDQPHEASTHDHLPSRDLQGFVGRTLSYPYQYTPSAAGHHLSEAAVRYSCSDPGYTREPVQYHRSSMNVELGSAYDGSRQNSWVAPGPRPSLPLSYSDVESPESRFIGDPHPPFTVMRPVTGDLERWLHLRRITTAVLANGGITPPDEQASSLQELDHIGGGLDNDAQYDIDWQPWPGYYRPHSTH